MNDHELDVRLGFNAFSNATWQNETKVMPDWLNVHRELQKNKNVTLSLLCQEYLRRNRYHGAAEGREILLAGL